MTYVADSFKNMQSIVSTAQATATVVKSTGFSGIAGDSAGGALAGFTSQRANRERYGLFRGWVYAAINAIAMEAAGQDFNVARNVSDPELQEEARTNPGRFKSLKNIPKGMRKHLRKKNVNASLEILSDNPLIDLISEPNSIQSTWEFVYSFVANLNLTGWSYVIAGENEEGKLQMFSLPTTWITPDHKEGPFSRFHIRNPNKPEEGTSDPIPRENVGFAYIPNPGDPLGAIAPAGAQTRSIRIDDHIQSSQEVFFENGIFPSVVVTVGKQPHPDVPGGLRPRLTGPQRRQVESIIRKTMGSVANYGNPAIVDGLIENITRLSATQNEMGWEKSEGIVKTRILSAFGVHPYILGEPVNVGGYAQAAKIEERFCKRVNTFLCLLGGVLTNFGSGIVNEELVTWWEECEPHDPSIRSKQLTDARKNGDITREEIRAELGFPPLEEEVVSRNQLLSTVGGMNGATQLLIQVGQGLVAPEQAARLLSLFLEIPLEEAEIIVGAGTEESQLQEAVGALNDAVNYLDDTPKEAALKLLTK